MVGDDGRGGADVDKGTGMRGVMRRLAAFDGTMRVSSPDRRAHPRHPGGAVRLVLAEDNALLRAGLTQLLEGVRLRRRPRGGQRRRARRALADPDVDGAVLDVRMPPTFTDEGLRAAIAVRARRPGFPVLVLSQYVEQLYARELLASGEGAVGYLLKDRVSDVREFVDGVRRVLAGGTVLDPEVVAAVMARQRDEPMDRLTAREREVLGADGRGPFQRLDRPPRSSSPRRPWPSTSTASSRSSTCRSTSRSTGGCRRCWRTCVCDRPRAVARCGRRPEPRRPARARA